MADKVTKKLRDIDRNTWLDIGLFLAVSLMLVLLPGWQAPGYFYLLFILRMVARRRRRQVLFGVMLSCLAYLLVFLFRSAPMLHFIWMWALYVLTGLSVTIFIYGKRVRENRYREEYTAKREVLEEATERELSLRSQHKRLEDRLNELSGIFTGVKQMLRERLNFEDVIAESSEMISWVTDERKMILLIADEEEKTAEVIYSVGAGTGLKGQRLELASGSVLSELWKNKSTRLYREPAKAFPEVPLPRAFGSLLISPLSVASEVIGLVLLFLGGG